MRIQGLWECPYQDQEVSAKHIDSTERFQHASHEPIPPLAGRQPGELIDLEDDLVEDPGLQWLRGDKEPIVETEQESSQMEDQEENDTLAILWFLAFYRLLNFNKTLFLLVVDIFEQIIIFTFLVCGVVVHCFAYWTTIIFTMSLIVGYTNKLWLKCLIKTNVII